MIWPSGGALSVVILWQVLRFGRLYIRNGITFQQIYNLAQYGNPLRRFRSASSMSFASLRTSSAHSRGRLASSAEIPYCWLSSDQVGRLRCGRLLCSGVACFCGSDVICNPSERGAGLRWIALDCKSSERGFSSVSADKPTAATTREESPPRSSPQRVSGARQQIINLRQLAVDCKSASTCKVALCFPQ